MSCPPGLEYRFTLVDAVEDCAEYLVRPETFIALAREGAHATFDRLAPPVGLDGLLPVAPAAALTAPARRAPRFSAEGLELRKIQNFAKFVRDRLKEQWPRDLWVSRPRRRPFASPCARARALWSVSWRAGAPVQAERGLGGLDNGSGYIPEPILSQDDWYGVERLRVLRCRVRSWLAWCADSLAQTQGSLLPVFCFPFRQGAKRISRD